MYGGGSSPAICWSAITQNFELCLNKTSTTNQGSVSPGAGGIGWSGGSNPTFASDTTYNITGGVTIFALITPSAVSADTSVISKTVSNGATNTPYDFGLNNAKGRLGLANAGGYRVWASGSNLFSAGETGVLAIASNQAMESAPAFYKNGVFDSATPTSLYSGGGSGVSTGNTAPVLIGNRGDGVTGFSGNIYFVVVIPGTLHGDDIRKVSQDLFQFLRP